MADPALESWLRDYRAAHPQLDPAWIFLRRDPRRDAYGAFEALKQEWLDAVYAIRAQNVAATKLQWWMEELQRAHEGRARHPLTQAVFADERARAIPLARWNEVFQAALLELEGPPVSDLSAQLAQAAPLHGAIARIEAALWFGGGVDEQRAEKSAAVQRVVSALRNLPMEVDYGRTPLPMSLLARHGLSQNALMDDGDSRRAALRDQARNLLRALDEAAKLSGPLSLFRGLQVRLDRRALRRALRADEPLAAMQGLTGGLGALFEAWKAARAWHSAQQP
ncbi:MAG TPA: squalene/phytoene synthase family protein [Rhodanobacteraceae bacterium]|nr:squalene/phytoene synthase family protein [Rhodanobacteraceae bacterium]